MRVCAFEVARWTLEEVGVPNALAWLRMTGKGARCVCSVKTPDYKPLLWNGLDLETPRAKEMFKQARCRWGRVRAGNVGRASHF